MVLLRPRLRCHYCGERCHVKRKEENRFKCEHCLAVNFFDENGEIADVPPEEAADPEQILSEADSPGGGSRFESSIFCQTCVKNQLYFNNSLSEYLPDLDDPRYAKFEARLPEYRKQLEDRYPQVCAQCEPRVRAQLQQATYTAKSDHVRRMLAKSRERRIASRLGWRSIVVTIGGIGYWTSIAGQMLWHAMGALSSDRIAVGEQSLSDCLSGLLVKQLASRACTEHFESLASHTLKLGILCLWWNPQWQHKLAGVDGRLIHLEAYYRAQTAILIFRFALWALLQNQIFTSRTPDLHKGLHGISLVLMMILLTWSNIAIIKIDTTPLVDWSQDIGPLLSRNQFVPPQAPSQQLFSPPNSQSISSQPRQFHIGNLGSAPSQIYEAWKSPTPPTEDPDAMDWEPLSSQFTAKPRKPLVKHVEPSPFYGTLPALNTRGVQHTRSVENPKQREAMGIPPGFFDSGRKSNPQRPSESAPPAFAEPSFFPQQDTSTLGLEKIFDDVFRLKDDTVPSIPPSVITQHQQGKAEIFQTSSYDVPVLMNASQKRWKASKTLAAISLPFLALGLVIWLSEDFGIFYPENLKLYVSSFAATVCLLHLLLRMASMQRSSEHSGLPKSFGTFLSLAEFGIFTALSFYRWSYGCETRGSAGKVDPLLICGMIWQEWFYFMMLDDSLTSARPPPPPPPPNTLQQPLSDQPFTTTELGPSSGSPNPSEATTVKQTGFGRPRGNSIDSVDSSVTTTSTTSTAPGWKTPKIDPRRAPSSIGGPSPGFGLGGLRLDELGSSSGATIAGPRQRTNLSGTAGRRMR